MWQVFCNKKFIGITETNLDWATTYWADRSRETGKKFTLVPCDTANAL